MSHDFKWQLDWEFNHNSLDQNPFQSLTLFDQNLFLLRYSIFLFSNFLTLPQLECSPHSLMAEYSTFNHDSMLQTTRLLSPSIDGSLFKIINKNQQDLKHKSLSNFKRFSLFSFRRLRDRIRGPWLRIKTQEEAGRNNSSPETLLPKTVKLNLAFSVKEGIWPF